MESLENGMVGLLQAWGRRWEAWPVRTELWWQEMVRRQWRRKVLREIESEMRKIKRNEEWVIRMRLMFRLELCGNLSLVPGFTTDDLWAPSTRRIETRQRTKVNEMTDLPDAPKLTKTHNLIKTPEYFLKLQTNPLLYPNALGFKWDFARVIHTSNRTR